MIGAVVFPREKDGPMRARTQAAHCCARSSRPHLDGDVSMFGAKIEEQTRFA